MRGLRLTMLLLTALALGAGAGGVAGQGRTPKGGRTPAATEAAAPMSLDEAVAMAERRFRARVVRADARREDGRTVYVLRLLSESGRVWTVRIDAATGALL